jgi:hypothetical protein
MDMAVMHFHRNACHVYSSVAKVVEEKKCSRVVPHALMTEQNPECIASFQDLLSIAEDEN